MKRILAKSMIIIFMVTLLVACASSNTEDDISDYNWKMESVSDLEGNPLENDMDIDFERDNSFILKDKLNNKEWKGEYTSEKVDSSYKIDLFFEDLEEASVGVYGIREREDRTEVPAITIQFEDKIISFIANE